jgi:hypothetical protein
VFIVITVSEVEVEVTGENDGHVVVAESFESQPHSLSRTRCGDTSRRSTATESTELACTAALLRSLCRLLYSAKVVLVLFGSSWDALFSRCARLHFCIFSTFEFRGISKVQSFYYFLKTESLSYPNVTRLFSPSRCSRSIDTSYVWIG